MSEKNSTYDQLRELEAQADTLRQSIAEAAKAKEASLDKVPGRLRAWREHRDLSQQGLAALCGMSASTIHASETGIRKLTARAIILIAVGLSMTIDDLVNSDSKPKGTTP